MKIVAVAALFALSTAFLAPPVEAAGRRHFPTTLDLPVATSTKAYTAVEYQGDGGAVDPAMPMHVVVGLALRNRSMVDGILRGQVTPGSSNYGQSLSTYQTLSWFSPTGAQVGAVAQYLAANGFKNIQATPDNVLVTADATAGNVQQAFYTQIRYLVVAGQHIYGNVTPASVPSSLGSIVVAVEGLNNFSMHTAVRAPAARRLKRPGPALTAGAGGCTSVPLINACVLNEFGPHALAKFYDAAGAVTGAKTNIAIIAQGDLSQTTRDLRSFEALYNLPQVPYSVIATGPASSDASGTPEWDLDTQYSTGIAHAVKALILYDAPSLTDADTTVGFSRFESDNQARAASASFGSCEAFPALDGTLVVDDEIFALAALHGQTLFAAAGDNGTTCPVVVSTGVPVTGLPMQSYPASSPYVVSVGGTTALANSDNSYNAEVAWVGTGGGVSTQENSPFWQQGVVPIVNNPPPPVPGVTTFKAVPDIAMDADPNTGANVVAAGQQVELGGTSLASPLALGVWARLETQHYNGLGFAAPLLYKQYADLKPPAGSLPPPGALTQTIGGFHDVLFGTNGTLAAPQYDYATGLGTLDTILQNTDITR